LQHDPQTLSVVDGVFARDATKTVRRSAREDYVPEVIIRLI
jgi:hypothetical protein